MCAHTTWPQRPLRHVPAVSGWPAHTAELTARTYEWPPANLHPLLQIPCYRLRLEGPPVVVLLVLRLSCSCRSLTWFAADAMAMDPSHTGPTNDGAQPGTGASTPQFLTIAARPSTASSLRRMFSDSGPASGVFTPSTSDERTSLLGDRGPGDVEQAFGRRKLAQGAQLCLSASAASHSLRSRWQDRRRSAATAPATRFALAEGQILYTINSMDTQLLLLTSRWRRSSWRDRCSYAHPSIRVLCIVSREAEPGYWSGKSQRMFILRITRRAGVQFAAAIPGMVYALLGTSHQLNVAPEAALSLLVGQAVSDILHEDPHTHPQDPEAVGLAIATIITFQVSTPSLLTDDLTHQYSFT